MRARFALIPLPTVFIVFNSSSNLIPFFRFSYRYGKSYKQETGRSSITLYYSQQFALHYRTELLRGHFSPWQGLTIIRHNSSSSNQSCHQHSRSWGQNSRTFLQFSKRSDRMLVRDEPIGSQNDPRMQERHGGITSCSNLSMSISRIVYRLSIFVPP